MELGSEIHIDMYDDRMEVYSPGGMFDGRLIQQLNPLTVPSKRRNPLLADFFHRLKLMERRGSGMKKIIGEYKRFENLENYHAPEFSSNATEFHVTLWNLNYGVDVVKDNPHVIKEANDVVKDVVKELSERQKIILDFITEDPALTAKEMSERMSGKTGVVPRTIQRDLAELQAKGIITREGGRKEGKWVIINKE